jgi:hypothetical protein
MPKIRMKNSPAHKKNVVIKISRKKSVGMVKQKKFDDWYMVPIEKLVVTCIYQDKLEKLEDDLFYNKYGIVTGWHPLVYSEFWNPYMGQIRNTMFSMKTDETRTIKVTRR